MYLNLTKNIEYAPSYISFKSKFSRFIALPMYMYSQHTLLTLPFKLADVWPKKQMLDIFAHSELNAKESNF